MSRGLAVVLLLGLVAHGIGLANGFVYDDHRFVDENPALATLDVPTALLDPASQTADRDQDVYRPLRALGHAFDLRRWGLDPFGFHLHSLLVHLATVALAFALLRHLFAPHGDGPALAGAALLAVHPLGAEVVGWISSRGDEYALLFGLGALAVGTGALRQRSATLVLGALLAALATLGKESAAVLPVIAWLHGRLLGRHRERLGPWALALGVAGALVLRQVALRGTSPIQTPPHGGDHLTQAGWALYGFGRTLGLLAWPVGLSVDHPQRLWAAGLPVWLRPATALGLAAVLAPWVARRRLPRVAFALGWMALAYLPSSSLLVTLRSLVTDRAAYPLLPAAGALVGLALPAGRPLRRGLAVASACLLAGLTIARTADFHDDGTLWASVLAQDPGSVQAHLGLAATLAGRDPQRASSELRQAVELAPPGSKLEAVSLARLGDHVLRREDDPERAVPLLERALAACERWSEQERPGHPSLDELATAASLAEALTRLRRYDEGEAVLARALERSDDRAPLLVKQVQLRLVRARADDDARALEGARASWRALRSGAPDHPLLPVLQQWIEAAAEQLGARGD